MAEKIWPGCIFWEDRQLYEDFYTLLYPKALNWCAGYLSCYHILFRTYVEDAVMTFWTKSISTSAIRLWPHGQQNAPTQSTINNYILHVLFVEI